jgi:hypothetical protein
MMRRTTALTILVGLLEAGSLASAQTVAPRTLVMPFENMVREDLFFCV